MLYQEKSGNPAADSKHRIARLGFSSSFYLEPIQLNLTSTTIQQGKLV
jgi:hypothetical protein